MTREIITFLSVVKVTDSNSSVMALFRYNFTEIQLNLNPNRVKKEAYQGVQIYQVCWSN